MTSTTPLVEIVSTGRFLPDRVVTNRDMESIVDTSDEWIFERTGIRERRIAPPEMTAAAMGAGAARMAMERAGVAPEDVDILIVSTATPDRLLPATSCDIQALIGATNAVAFDVVGACTGFLYALTVAEGYISTGRGEIALVIATEKLSAIVDWEDRSTCVLFGDGSGAAIVRSSAGEKGILGTHHQSDGRLANLLYRPAGGAAIPMDEEVLRNRTHLIQMSGREVFKHAVRAMADSAGQALARSGWALDDVDLVFPHQANIRIIKATARYAGLPMEKVFVNVHRYGNMSSATIPVAMDEAIEEGRLQPGMKLLLVAFGAGLTWGAMAVRW
ncbi:MAG: ketoacyl-ACP synthase III [Gemmatimonadetes bacterium]|nr:ketoacyl-ACP synthase III [Gemmatimonadota bacterium]